VLDALARIHESSWDEAQAMVRVLPGTDVDAAQRRLHPVRETALGAYLDLSRGEPERARRAIEQVLRHQYLTPGLRWSGTFKVTAEDEDPATAPDGRRGFDANWRQFVGVALALCLEDHPDAIDHDLQAAIVGAISTAVHGEPEGRIPDWYTNPALMHAWLCDWVGRRTNDPVLQRKAESVATTQLGRLRDQGDVDEYNSPTYDGINLMAGALMVELPTSPLVSELGHTVLDSVGSRLGALYAPTLGAICGPYLRAYAVDLAGYVSLDGLWLALLGAGDVLPDPLTETSVHVHDLYFAPVFRRLLAPVAKTVALDESALQHGTRHGVLRREHRVGEVVSVSLRTESLAVGGESGRVPAFARDQYVPWTLHRRVPGPGRTGWLAVKLGDDTVAVDAVVRRDGSADLTVRAPDGGSAACRVLASEELRPTSTGFETRAGRLVLESPLTRVTAEATRVGHQYLLEFRDPTVHLLAEPS
jgi:hypothetical protein